MAASGKLTSKNDHLIEELIKDPLFKVDKEGKIFSKITENGQGIQDKWREVGYQKEELIGSTIVTIIVSLAIGFFIFGVDLGLSQVMRMLLGF